MDGRGNKTGGLADLFSFFYFLSYDYKGFGGGAICWLRGMIARLGIAAETVGLCAVSFLLSAGCTPPLNVSCAFIVEASILSHLSCMND